MKTSISHLPEHKQQELTSIVEYLKSELDLDMLILFGSYARGDWVEDLDEETLLYRYQSDFDLLIITQTQSYAQKIEKDLQLSRRLNKHFQRTPVSLIAEDITFVNNRLRKSQYFYIDVLREGIVLFDAGKLELAEPKELTIKQRAFLAKEDYDYWFTSADGFYKMYLTAIQQNEFNIAAFQLHQATERLYSAIALVYTRYKPKSHDLTSLGQRAASIEPKFLEAFPMDTKEKRECFELLRKAYVDARYKPSYSITLEQLQYLGERVKVLQQLTEQLCQAKIAEFK